MTVDVMALCDACGRDWHINIQHVVNYLKSNKILDNENFGWDEKWSVTFGHIHALMMNTCIWITCIFNVYFLYQQTTFLIDMYMFFDTQMTVWVWGPLVWSVISLNFVINHSFLWYTCSWIDFSILYLIELYLVMCLLIYHTFL